MNNKALGTNILKARQAKGWTQDFAAEKCGLSENYFRQIGRRPFSRIYVDDTRSALSAVEQGLGNCLLTAIPHTDKLVNYLILPDFLPEEQNVFLITRRKDAPGKSLKCLCRLAHELYQEF